MQNITKRPTKKKGKSHERLNLADLNISLHPSHIVILPIFNLLLWEKILLFVTSFTRSG
jgi:hypothetical protein